MLAPGGDDATLPGQLAVAINIERADRVALAPRQVAAATEDVIGAVVQQPGPALVRQLRQQTRASALMRCASAGSLSALSTAV